MLLVLGNSGDVVLACFCLVAGPAEDLEVIGFVGSPQSKREDVINVPGFAGVDLLINIYGIMMFLQRYVRRKKY